MVKDSASRLTVLTTLGINAVKTYRTGKSGKIEVEGYGRAKTFTASEIEVDDRGKWLERLRKKTESFVVLGQPKNWKKGERKRRLSSARDGAEATIIDVPRMWMPIDVDQMDFEPMAEIDDGEMLCLELMSRLKLKGVHVVWHLTNSHGFFGKHRARLWVMLEKPALASEMKEFAKLRWGDETVMVDGKEKRIVDVSVYQSQQPIYTGDPILEDVEDPVTRRVGFVEGDALRLKLPKKAKAKNGAPEDENIAKLQEAGLYIGRLKPGQHMIECPWEDSHSGESRDDDTFYFEPHHNGHDIPAFKCHHATCEEKRWSDVVEFMGEEIDPSEDEDEEKAPNWVYVHRLKAFWDARDGAMIDRESYDSTHGGKSKKGTPTDRFLAMKRSQKADTVEFLPGQERFVMRGRVRVLNTYVEQRTQPDPAIDATMWTEHLEWVIPDREDREHMMDWLAWCYQNPGIKITWSPILYGPPGTGKTTVFNCLSACIGQSYVSEPTQAELEDKFNDWCYGKLLVKIEELMSGDKFHVAEKLKPIVANPTISVRQMHKTGFVVTNVANVCASTNHMQALPIEKGDRRYMLIQCVDAVDEVRSPRMRAFHKWLGEVGYGGIAHWLDSRDVSHFMPTAEAPMTRLKRIVQEASMTDFDRAVELCDVFDGTELISSAMVREYLQQNECTVNERKIGLIAAKRKWVSLPNQEGRVMIGNRKLTFWTSQGKQLKLRAFLAKKPGERERIHSNVAAKMVFGSGAASEDAEVL